jgi:hypothetical protein
MSQCCVLKYQPSPGADEDGHCIVCGYELELEQFTLEPHECPPGFHQPQHDGAEMYPRP